MKRLAPLLLAAVGGVSVASHAEEGETDETIYLPAKATDEIAEREGEMVVVHGRTSGSEKTESGTNFVRFGDAEFFLVTFASDLDQFPGGEPHERYEGERIAVTGLVSIYRGKPQIKLTDPAMVRILGENEEFPPEPEPEKETPVVAGASNEAEASGEDAPEAEPEEKPKPPVDASLYFE